MRRNKQEEERARRLAEEKARLKRLYGSEYKHGMVDAKGDFAADGKESRDHSDLRGCKDDFNASLHADAKGGAESGADIKGNDLGHVAGDSKGHEASDEAFGDFLSDKARESAQILFLEYKRQDAEYGLDMHLLIADIKSGKAFQPVPH